MKYLFLVSVKGLIGKLKNLLNKFNYKLILFWSYTYPLLFNYIPIRYRFIIIYKVF